MAAGEVPFPNSYGIESMVPSDSDLLAGALRGDEDSLVALLGRHGPAVSARVAGRIGRKWSSVLDADDVMQVTYLEVFLQIDRFTPTGPGSFFAWLDRIAQNNLRDAIAGLARAKRPQPQRRIDLADGDDSSVALFEVVGLTTSTPSRHAARHELAEAVEAALGRLPPDYEHVVRLYDLEGRPVAEIAESMNRSIGAIYMLRARAHDRLKTELEPSWAHLDERP